MLSATQSLYTDGSSSSPSVGYIYIYKSENNGISCREKGWYTCNEFGRVHIPRTKRLTVLFQEPNPTLCTSTIYGLYVYNRGYRSCGSGLCWLACRRVRREPAGSISDQHYIATHTTFTYVYVCVCVRLCYGGRGIRCRTGKAIGYDDGIEIHLQRERIIKLYYCGTWLGKSEIYIKSVTNCMHVCNCCCGEGFPLSKKKKKNVTFVTGGNLKFFFLLNNARSVCGGGKSITAEIVSLQKKKWTGRRRRVPSLLLFHAPRPVPRH